MSFIFLLSVLFPSVLSIGIWRHSRHRPLTADRVPNNPASIPSLHITNAFIVAVNEW
jgi:hypothetical protein